MEAAAAVAEGLVEVGRALALEAQAAEVGWAPVERVKVGARAASAAWLSQPYPSSRCCCCAYARRCAYG